MRKNRKTKRTVLQLRSEDEGRRAMTDEKERYYSLSMLRALAYDDDVNGSRDGKIDFTVIDSISGADVAPRAEVAREIFEEIQETLVFGVDRYRVLQLKKKYTEATPRPSSDRLTVMDNETKLKPCPFCGGKAEIDDMSFGQQNHEYTPFCTNPKCLVFYLGYHDNGLYKSKAKAIEAWNRRADDEQR